jgi:hypothetical protein
MVTTIHPSAGADRPAVTVRLSTQELELVELSLRALGYAPGHDYGQVQAARALADALPLRTLFEAGEPITAYEPATPGSPRRAPTLTLARATVIVSAAPPAEHH